MADNNISTNSFLGFSTQSLKSSTEHAVQQGKEIENNVNGILKLQYPVFADKIDIAHSYGYTDEQIEPMLRKREQAALTFYPPEDINRVLQRTPQTIQQAAHIENMFRINALKQATGTSLNDDEIHERITASKLTGVPASVLISDNEIFEKVKPFAKMRRTLFDSVRIGLANYVKSFSTPKSENDFNNWLLSLDEFQFQQAANNGQLTNEYLDLLETGFSFDDIKSYAAHKISRAQGWDNAVSSIADFLAPEPSPDPDSMLHSLLEIAPNVAAGIAEFWALKKIPGVSPATVLTFMGAWRGMSESNEQVYANRLAQGDSVPEAYSNAHNSLGLISAGIHGATSAAIMHTLGKPLQPFGIVGPVMQTAANVLDASAYSAMGTMAASSFNDFRSGQNVDSEKALQEGRKSALWTGLFGLFSNLLHGKTLLNKQRDFNTLRKINNVLDNYGYTPISEKFSFQNSIMQIVRDLRNGILTHQELIDMFSDMGVSQEKIYSFINEYGHSNKPISKYSAIDADFSDSNEPINTDNIQPQNETLTSNIPETKPAASPIVTPPPANFTPNAPSWVFIPKAEWEIYNQSIQNNDIIPVAEIKETGEVMLNGQDFQRLKSTAPDFVERIKDNIRDSANAVTKREKSLSDSDNTNDDNSLNWNSPRIKTLRKKLFQQWREAGYTRGQAKSIADMITDFAINYSYRTGIDPEDAVRISITNRENIYPENPPAENSNTVKPVTPPKEYTKKERSKITPKNEAQQQNLTGGNSARIRTIRGTEADIRYRIIDADDLIASTNETGAPNPDYPQELQPRQRDREASFEQIDRIANNIDPELVADNRLASDGAPVIGSDLVVESGNGRVLGIRKAYKTGQAENYRSWLINNAARFGLDSNIIASMQNPVLVRERISDVDRIKFTREANESSIAQMSASEFAAVDADKISQSMLLDYNPSVPLENNRSFIRSFISHMNKNELNSFLQADGKISLYGINRLKNALAAKAYRNTAILNRLSEIYDDEIKNVSNALYDAAPRIAMIEDGAYSIRDDIVQAVNTLATLKKEGSSVSDFLSQILMFSEDDISLEAKKILQFFDKNKRSRKKIALALNRYADLAVHEAGNNTIIIPGMEVPARSKMSLLDEAIQYADNGGQIGLFETYNQTKKFTFDINNPNDSDAYDPYTWPDSSERKKALPLYEKYQELLRSKKTKSDSMSQQQLDDLDEKINDIEYELETLYEQQPEEFFEPPEEEVLKPIYPFSDFFVSEEFLKLSEQYQKLVDEGIIDPERITKASRADIDDNLDPDNPYTWWNTPARLKALIIYDPLDKWYQELDKWYEEHKDDYTPGLKEPSMPKNIAAIEKKISKLYSEASREIETLDDFEEALSEYEEYEERVKNRQKKLNSYESYYQKGTTTHSETSPDTNNPEENDNSTPDTQHPFYKFYNSAKFKKLNKKYQALVEQGKIDPQRITTETDLEIIADDNNPLDPYTWPDTPARLKALVIFDPLDKWLKEHEEYDDDDMPVNIADLRDKIWELSNESDDEAFELNWYEGEKKNGSIFSRLHISNANSDENKISQQVQPQEQPKVQNQSGTATLADFKKAFDKLERGRVFVNLPELRKKLNWPHDVFDEMIRKLWDENIVRLIKTEIGDFDVNDFFYDEDNTRRGMVTWNDVDDDNNEKEIDINTHDFDIPFAAETQSMPDASKYPAAAIAHFILSDKTRFIPTMSQNFSALRDLANNVGIDNAAFDSIILSMIDMGIITPVKGDNSDNKGILIDDKRYPLFKINSTDALEYVIDNPKAFNSQNTVTDDETPAPAPVPVPEEIPESYSEIQQQAELNNEEQIKSSNFKRWFGDWENDKQNSSKIVDVHGKPLILEHQTGEEFSVFDPIHDGAGLEDYETPYGIFLKDPNNDVVIENSRFHMLLYANIRNPLIVKDRIDIVHKLQDFEPYIDAYDRARKIERDVQKALLAIDETDSESDEEEKAIEKATELEDNFDNASRKAKTILRQWLIDNGYDGIILENDEGYSDGRRKVVMRTVIALHKNQVKSADKNSGAFSPDNDDVYDNDITTPQNVTPSELGPDTELINEEISDKQILPTQNEAVPDYTPEQLTPGISYQKENVPEVEQVDYSPEFNEDIYSPDYELNNAVLQDIPDQHIPDQQEQPIIKGRISWQKDIPAYEQPSIMELSNTHKDPTTAIHEIGHHIAKLLFDAVQFKGVDGEIKDDVNAVLNHSGVSYEDYINDNNGAKEKVHEDFADEFTKFTASGNAPNERLRRAFSRIRAWLIDLFRDLQRRNYKIDENMRRVFEHLFTSQEKIDYASKIGELASEAAALRDLLTQAQNDLRTQIQDNAAKQKENETLQSQLISANDEISDLQQNLSLNQQTISAQQKQLDDSQSQIDKLQQDLRNETISAAQQTQRADFFQNAMNEAYDDLVKQQEQTAENSLEWEQTAENAFVQGKNTGERYGIQEGMRQQKQKDDELLNRTLLDEHSKQALELARLSDKKDAQIERVRERYSDRIDALADRYDDRIAKLKKRLEEISKIKPAIQNNLKQIARMAKSKNISYNAQQKINELLSGFDLKKRSRDTLSHRKDVDTFLRAYPESAEQMTPDEIRFAGTTNIADMTLDDLRYLKWQVKLLHDEGRREFEQWQAEAKQRRGNIRNNLVERILRFKAPDEHIITSREDIGKQYNGIKGKAQKAKDWSSAVLRTPDRVFDILDGGGANYNGPWVENFIDIPREKINEAQSFINSRKDKMIKALAQLGFKISDFGKTAAVIDGQKFSFDKIMEIFLGMRNPKKAKAIIFGNFVNPRGYSPEQAKDVINQLISKLTPEQMKAAELVIQDHNDNFQRINNFLINTFNKGMKQEVDYTSMHRLLSNSPLSPLFIDPDDDNALRNGLSDSELLQKLETGFMLSRQNISDENQQPLDLGLFSNWMRDISRHEFAAALGQTASDLMSVLLSKNNNRQTLMRMIADRFGNTMRKSVVSIFNDTFTDNQRAADEFLLSVAGALSRNMSAAYIAYNMGVYVMQTMSYPLFLMSARPDYLFSSVAKFFRNPRAFLDNVYRLSPTIKNMGRDPTDNRDNLMRSLNSSFWQKVINAGLEPTSILDRITKAIGWQATYDTNIKRGLSHENAIREADRAVRLTQPPSNTRDTMRITRNGPVAALKMKFTYALASAWNMTTYDFIQKLFSKGWNNIKSAFSTFAGLALTAMLVKFMHDGGPDRDNDENVSQWVAGAFSDQSINSIPLIGKDAMQSYNKYFRGKRGHSQFDAFSAPVDKVLNAMGIISKEDKSDDDYARLGWLVLEALSLTTGLSPYSGLKQTIRSFMMAADGEPLKGIANLLGFRQKE